MAKLYLVSSAIGNLSDISLRAIAVLNEADVIMAEDTREVIKIMDKYCQRPVKPRYFSYTDHNCNQRIYLVLQLLQAGKNVALVSDRGTPLISDPGYKLVKEVIKINQTHPAIKVEAIPGANAILPALQLSGLPPDKFYFVGFLPKKALQRQKLLQELPKTTIIAFESPYRLCETLQDIKSVLGSQTQIAVCRELTKVHEEVSRGSIDDVIRYYLEKPVKGEITLVFKTPNC